MDTKQRFGGDWTIEKLEILSSYLDFYINALKNMKFKKIYIDAFAGTGYIKVGDSEEVIEGSAKLALNATNKFDKYIFIEKNKKFAQELNQLINNEYNKFSNKIQVKNEDCNIELQNLCENTDWRYNRAILFLDLYATAVKWTTLQVIASTKAIDVWYLFPLSAVNRMMPRNKEIDPSWKAKLDMLFGDSGWESEFYKENPQMNLFGEESYIKEVNTESLKNYICSRLSTIFPAVSQNPKILYNTKNSPLFLFCFAVSNDNEKAIKLAMRVANHILKTRA